MSGRRGEESIRSLPGPDGGPTARLRWRLSVPRPGLLRNRYHRQRTVSPRIGAIGSRHCQRRGARLAGGGCKRGTHGLSPPHVDGR